MDDLRKIAELRSKGYCCAQVMVGMGLLAKGEENDEFLQAVSGLCGGMRNMLLCGALSGAACMMTMLDKENSREMIADLKEWFEGEYGTTLCGELVEYDATNKAHVCPPLIENTYLHVKEILGEYGVDLDAMYEEHEVK